MLQQILVIFLQKDNILCEWDLGACLLTPMFYLFTAFGDFISEIVSCFSYRNVFTPVLCWDD
jgi:branched-subunit amino acid permease